MLPKTTTDFQAVPRSARLRIAVVNGAASETRPKTARWPAELIRVSVGKVLGLASDDR